MRTAGPAGNGTDDGTVAVAAVQVAAAFATNGFVDGRVRRGRIGAVVPPAPLAVREPVALCDAFVAGDFFSRLDRVGFLGVFGLATRSSSTSADTSSVHRTPRPSRAAGILIACFDTSGASFAEEERRQFTYPRFVREKRAARARAFQNGALGYESRQGLAPGRLIA